MRPALAYSPGRSPLHRSSAAVAVAFLGSLALIAFVYSSPLVLLADGAAVVIAGVAAGARRAVVASLRFALPLMVLMIVVNGLVYHRGETVLLRGWDMPVLGNTNVTLESLIAGGAIGLRVVVVVLAFAVYSACVDPDKVLRALRPVAKRSALTAALVVRMVPVAAADAARLREAADLRGPAAEPVGRAALARRLVEGSLDRAIEVAATLELRGHSLEARTQPRRDPTAPAGALIAATVLILAVAAAGHLVGAGGFDTFPGVSADTGPATLAVCAALPLLAWLPFAADRVPRRAAAPRVRVGGAGA
jgi:energy-coupling factor transport system permease protein